MRPRSCRPRKERDEQHGCRGQGKTRLDDEDCEHDASPRESLFSQCNAAASELLDAAHKKLQPIDSERLTQGAAPVLWGLPGREAADDPNAVVIAFGDERPALCGDGPATALGHGAQADLAHSRG